ncbi:hypothetical protein BDY19DRAFT_910504 [Irpex rosettiformis]|uniref:Uncharacterized protein n=1 Tax=Irpex rosettiformis TaxID=378272 RepID=A0ACB8TNF5_9APHY|nr:hypothetical protein BDY19DRAFT_910504 [Irpex rosettiformis]
MNMENAQIARQPKSPCIRSPAAAKWLRPLQLLDKSTKGVVQYNCFTGRITALIGLPTRKPQVVQTQLQEYAAALQSLRTPRLLDQSTKVSPRHNCKNMQSCYSPNWAPNPQTAGRLDATAKVVQTQLQEYAVALQSLRTPRLLDQSTKMSPRHNCKSLFLALEQKAPTPNQDFKSVDYVHDMKIPGGVCCEDSVYGDAGRGCVDMQGKVFVFFHGC